MELVKKEWKKEDKREFQAYLKSFSKGEKKALLEKNISRTNLDCIAVSSRDVENITKQILKGNFLSFLDLNLWDNLTTTFINAKLISHIKDFQVLKRYLDEFVYKADNWASIDSLKFDTKQKEQEFLNLAEVYLKDKKPFTRRAGVRMLFKFIDIKHISKVFDLISNFKDENEYYVNMAISWLVCECFIKERSETLNFLKQQILSTFVQNKAISKCRDSFRISKEDKEMLLSLRIKDGD